MEEKKLNIGLFLDTWYPIIDGVTNVVNNYAIELSKYANVTVFTCGTKKEDTRVYPYKVVRGGSIATKFLDYEIPTVTKSLKKAIKDANLDIMHTHSPFSLGKLAVKMGKKYNIPVVGSVHSQYYQDFMRYTKNKFISKRLLNAIVKVYNACDKMYAPCQQTVDIVEKEYGIKDVSVQENATSLKPLENTQVAFEYYEEKYNIKKDEKVLLFLGRINKIKNLEFMIDALAKLKEMGQKFKMLFVGSGSDSEELQAKVKALGLDDCVLFTGRASDEEVVFAYARADLFLFPSLYDTSSLVQIEAASQKTPTLFIRGSSTSCSILENVNGFMAKDDVEDYAKRIYEILNDDKLYKEVCENAYRDLYKSWDEAVGVMYQKYLKIIEDYKNKSK
ncbi:MAG: glycosyltransferase [Clostridia bacterium]|nr:glycosyltransferase [Clostridia bacterium]